MNTEKRPAEPARPARGAETTAVVAVDLIGCADDAHAPDPAAVVSTLNWQLDTPEWHAFHAVAEPLIRTGASYGDVGKATGLTYSAARARCLRHGLRTTAGPGRRPSIQRSTHSNA